ncbi:MAG: hypothetical protein JO053_09175 [Acidobacteria bacterium]|nr:hypothetical protein [Acidobacteriota bacterium]
MLQKELEKAHSDEAKRLEDDIKSLEKNKQPVPDSMKDDLEKNKKSAGDDEKKAKAQKEALQKLSPSN